MKNTILDIFNYMSQCYEAYTRYNKAIADLKERYVNAELEKWSNTERARLETEVFRFTGNIKTCLLVIEQKAKAMNEYIPSDSAEVMNTAELLKAPGIPMAAVLNIISKFIGNQTNLNLLKANCHPDYADCFNSLIASVPELIRESEGFIARAEFNYSTTEMVFSLSKLRETMMKLAQVYGIEFTKKELEILDSLRAGSVQAYLNL